MYKIGFDHVIVFFSSNAAKKLSVTYTLAFYENQRFHAESSENTEFHPLFLSERP